MIAFQIPMSIEMLLKQGFYNYKYVVVNRDGTIDYGAISGNYWQTENDYTGVGVF